MAPDIHTLSGAYALDAVEPEERAEFEQHLALCEACAEEVAALQSAAAQIGEGLATAPALSLRARVIAEAARTPQLPPVVTLAERMADQRRRFPRLVAAAAAVVVLVGGGFVVRDAITDDASVPSAAVSAAEVFGSADARVASEALKGGQVRVGISKDLGLVAVDGADMPKPPRGTVYQLWLLDDAGAHSLSIMEGGVTSAVHEIPAEGTLAVTLEPAGGSTEPTTPAIVEVDPFEI